MASEGLVHGTWPQALGGVESFSPHDRQEAKKGDRKGLQEKIS